MLNQTMFHKLGQREYFYLDNWEFNANMNILEFMSFSMELKQKVVGDWVYQHPVLRFSNLFM